jgi:hypothetical protein
LRRAFRGKEGNKIEKKAGLFGYSWSIEELRQSLTRRGNRKGAAIEEEVFHRHRVLIKATARLLGVVQFGNEPMGFSIQPVPAEG